MDLSSVNETVLAAPVNNNKRATRERRTEGWSHWVSKNGWSICGGVPQCVCECLCLCQSVCTAKDNSCKGICAGIVGIETELTCTAIQYLCLPARCKVQTRAFRIEQSFSGRTNCSLPWFPQTLAAHSQISKDGQIFMLSSLFECWNLVNTYQSAWFGSTFHHQKVFSLPKLLRYFHVLVRVSSHPGLSSWLLNILPLRHHLKCQKSGEMSEH